MTIRPDGLEHSPRGAAMPCRTSCFFGLLLTSLAVCLSQEAANSPDEKVLATRRKNATEILVIDADSLATPSVDDIERNFKPNLEATEELIARLQHRLDVLSQLKRVAGKRRPTHDVDNPAELERVLKEEQGLLSQMAIVRLGRQAIRAPLKDDPFHEGDIGKLESKAGFFEVAQIIDDTNLIVKSGDRSLWVTQVGTATIVAGQDVKFANAMKVAGTKKQPGPDGKEQSLPIVQPVAAHSMETKVRLALIAQRANAKPAPEQAKYAGRIAWRNYSYDTVIYRVKDKEWEEKERQTGKVRWKLEEKAVTDDYIDLYNATRKQTWRLRPLYLEMLEVAPPYRFVMGEWE